jgi:hypothetical protein
MAKVVLFMKRASAAALLKKHVAILISKSPLGDAGQNLATCMRIQCGLYNRQNTEASLEGSGGHADWRGREGD